MTDTSGGRGLHVVILGDCIPYPQGMAVTARARLVARALAQAGASVRVLSMQASERPPHVQNTLARGCVDGVQFEYTCGTTTRHRRFVVRRLVGAWGWLNGALRLVGLRKEGSLDLVYLWFWTPRPALRLLFFVVLLRLMRVPVIREINETQWSLKPAPTMARAPVVALGRRRRRCGYFGGASEWAARDRRRHEQFRVIDLPILVDVDERQPSPYPTSHPLVVFAGTPTYHLTIEFIISAMQEVWKIHPECRLVITAMNPDVDWSGRYGGEHGLDSRIDLVGYLTRTQLLELYARAHALLIRFLKTSSPKRGSRPRSVST